MKYAIVGAGGIGASMGYFLANAGKEVWFVDPFEAHMKAVAENGLTVRKSTYEDASKWEEINVKINAVTDGADADKVDLVILVVQCIYTDSAIENIRKVCKDNTIVLTLQNGLGNVEKLEEHFNPDNVAFGTTTVTSTLVSPGVIHPKLPPANALYFGSKNPALADRLKELEADFQAGGCDAHYAPDMLKRQWEKLAMNCGGNGLGAILHLNARQCAVFPEYQEFADKIREEVYAVAKAKGIEIDLKTSGYKMPTFPIDKSPVPEHYASVAQDVMKRRKTDIMYLNGAICREGAALGIPTPYNDAVAKLVTIIENTYDWQFR